MKRVLLTDKAADEVLRIREDRYGTLSAEKGLIADGFGELSTLINLGRESDNEDLQGCADGILKVMEILNRYNTLLNLLCATSNCEDGRYEYAKPEHEFDPDNESIFTGSELESMKSIIAKHDVSLSVPVSVDAITRTEAAGLLGVSVEELHNLIIEERRLK